MTDEVISWYAAVDWGSEKHQACILDGAGKVAGEREFPHGGTGLAELGSWLMSFSGDASALAVAIKVPHGRGPRGPQAQTPRQLLPEAATSIA